MTTVKVKLIEWTGKGSSDPLYAAKLLAFTKNTRLNMSPEGFEEFLRRDEKFILDELRAMAITIPSSWEFVDMVFVLSGISRATAQQMTRTRTASYAMQSQRVTDMRNVSWTTKGLDAETMKRFDGKMRAGVDNYRETVESGFPLEDARDLLPIGVHTNLVAKYNFRNWIDLVRKRTSLRVQGAYRDIVGEMRREVLTVWPWASLFLTDPREDAFRLLEEAALEVAPKGAMSTGPANKIAKAIDLLKDTG